MDNKQVLHFKALLNQRLEYLLKNADSVVSELLAQPAQEIEYLDKASVYADQTMKLRIRTRESHLINKIRKALERIDNGIFGICESCGEQITPRRLEARPVTTKCIDCKEQEERMEHLLGA